MHEKRPSGERRVHLVAFKSRRGVGLPCVPAQDESLATICCAAPDNWTIEAPTGPPSALLAGQLVSRTPSTLDERSPGPRGAQRLLLALHDVIRVSSALRHSLRSRPKLPPHRCTELRGRLHCRPRRPTLNPDRRLLDHFCSPLWAQAPTSSNVGSWTARHALTRKICGPSLKRSTPKRRGSWTSAKCRQYLHCQYKCFSACLTCLEQEA